MGKAIGLVAPERPLREDPEAAGSSTYTVENDLRRWRALLAEAGWAACLTTALGFALVGDSSSERSEDEGETGVAKGKEIERVSVRGYTHMTHFFSSCSYSYHRSAAAPLRLHSYEQTSPVYEHKS